MSIIPVPPPMPPANYISSTSAKNIGIVAERMVDSVADGNLKAFETELAILEKIICRESLKNKINRTYFQLRHQTMLHMAALTNNLGIFKLLIEKGADLSKNRDAIYPISRKNGGEMFAMLEPRLEGKFLDVGQCSLCEEITSLYKFDCGHLFCYDCSCKWAKECALTQTPKCPQLNCTTPIHFNSFRHLLTPQDLETYTNSLLRISLSSTEDFEWCASCSSGYFLQKDKSMDCLNLNCPDCGYHWCALCRSVIHTGLTCEEAKIKLSMEDKENDNWKQLNTKKCPTCKVHIQKNSGCSHISCKHCKYEFCWICMNKYQPGKHTYDNNTTCPCVK